MTKLYYLRGALGKARLLEEHQEAIKKLLSGDYLSGNLEMLHGHRVYSYRLSGSARLLFAIHDFEGRPCLVILDYLPTHDYHKSSFLRPGVLKNYLERQEAEYRSIEEVRFVPYSGKKLVFTLPQETDEVPKLEVADYYQHTFITLNPGQQEACNVRLPALVSGVAGSGKSCVALSLLADYLSKHPRIKKDDPPLLYVSKSRALVDSMRRAWSELPIAQDVPTDLVLFMTYNELIHAEDKTTREFALVGEEAFALWYAGYLDAARKIARTMKTKLHELAASTAYQECRIASGYSQEDYERLGTKQSSIKEQPQRVFLYTIYETYRSLLAKQHQLNPEFHQFRPKKHYALVVTDEAQGLSHGQLVQLGQCAPDSIVFCMDSHQRLHDSHSVRPFLLEHFGIKESSHIELQVSHRCPMRVVAAANQVIALKHRLNGGLADKREPIRIDSSASEHNLGHVFLMPPESVLKNTWLQTQVAQPHCAIVTSEEHLEDAQKYFRDSLLVFTPHSIMGLEFDVVIAWKLYEPSVMAEARRRNALVSESKTSHPMHRPKKGVGEQHFGPGLNKLYTGYTRSKQVLIISEEPSHDNELLLKSLRCLADSDAPSERYLHQSSLSSDWEPLALRLMDVGNESLALTIFMSKLGKTEEQFNAVLARLRQKPAVMAEESKSPYGESKSPCEESKRPKRESKRPLPSVSSLDNKKSPPKAVGRGIGTSSTSSTLKKFSESSSSSSSAKYERLSEEKRSGVVVSSTLTIPKKPELTTSPKQYSALQKEAKDIILNLEKNFIAKRLELTLSCCDKSIWLHQYKDDKQNKPVVLADLILQERSWPIFTSLLINNPELLQKTPLEDILTYVNKKPGKIRLDDLKLLIRAQKIQGSTGTLNLPLLLATATGNVMLIRQLHKMGADINKLDHKGLSPATCSAGHGDVEALRVLSELGADLNKANNAGETPAMIAANDGNVKVLWVLKELGADLNKPNNKGETPVMSAVSNGHVEVLRVLGELGADINKPDNMGVTPVMSAVSDKRLAVLRVLIELGVDINKPDISGETHACTAASNGDVEALRIFKQLGADLTPIFTGLLNPAIYP